MAFKTPKFDKMAIFLIFLFLMIIYTITFLLGIPLKGYFLACLPLVFGLFFTKLLYKNYGKFLKASVDAILYFQASVLAVLLVMKTYVKEVPADLFTSHLHTKHGFLYVYAMAICSVTKCCISYCDSKVSQKEEHNKLVAKAQERLIQKNKQLEERKKSYFLGGLLILLLSIFFD